MINKFIWEKKGLIFAPNSRLEWMQSHSQNPSVLVQDDRLRVYFNCRPKRGDDGCFTSAAAFVDIDRNNPTNIIRVHDQPILSLGESGTFDQFGVMEGCVLPVGEEVWIYYVGWSRCQGVPYNHSIGLAISDDNGISFKRFGKGPILGRTPKEPFIQNSPFVTMIDNIFHMWYSSGLCWIEHEKRMESIYVLMHAISKDGINWIRDGVPCMPYIVEHECQTNPSLLKIGNRFHLWFCYRCGIDFRNSERGYRIGYAWSDDLINWNRDDSLSELTPSITGWDSQMVCYPRVVEVNNKLLMFYSGNGFGYSGFGYAELKEIGNE